MKRIYIALALLAAVAVLCVGAHLYLHTQTDRMLTALDSIETAYCKGDVAAAHKQAQEFATEYRRISDWISCYVAHGELRESRETAALLPSLIANGDRNGLYMEMARLRAQLEYIRQVDDAILRNIL